MLFLVVVETLLVLTILEKDLFWVILLIVEASYFYFKLRAMDLLVKLLSKWLKEFLTWIWLML